jgi:LemA protein
MDIMEFVSNNKGLSMGAGVGVGLVVFYRLYSNIIRNKNKVREALSSIDVQLNKRNDLLPNILRIAQKFMEHEKSLITEVTELRAAATRSYDHNDPQAIKAQLDIANQLQSKTAALMLNVENYPDLKSDQTMLTAQQTFNEVEEQIAAARRFYNSAVNDLNNSIEIFPGNILAAPLRVKAMPYFEADAKAKEPVNAGDYLR